VTRVEGDREFSCITQDLLSTPINIADADDHVHEVERSIRTIKERTRCLIQGLPFRRIPSIMMRAAVENANKSLNQFPAKNGVSQTLSPLTIMTGKPALNYNDLKIEFGAYAQVFESNDPTNTLKARTTGAIALMPTGNAQGGYFFLSLTTGRKLSRQQWDELPMPDGVIASVEQMAQDQGQPIVGHGAPFFEWSPGVDILDDIEEPTLDDEDELINIGNDEEEDETVEPTTDIEEDEGAETTSDEDYSTDDDGTDSQDYDENMSLENIDPPDEQLDNEEISEQRSEDDFHAIDDDVHEEQEPDADETHDEDFGHEAPTENRRSMRPNRERNYGHRFGHAMDNPASSCSYDETIPASQFFQHDRIGTYATVPLRDAVKELISTGSGTNVLRHISGAIFTQMTAKKGIQKHGQLAIDALFKEFEQLHDLDVFKAQDGKKLTKAQKRGALRAISMVKEKRCGKIKGRTVADGRPQRSLYTKEETTSPTVSNDALMISALIDGHEHRDVATADVTGAYLHADMDDFTLLKVEGPSVDILCSVCEAYREYVIIENGKKVLYLKLLKALYGCVKSALLWYELFCGELQGMGFELNPYDTCVANMSINGRQCTIAWYVDDTKISHKEAPVVTSVIARIESKFGKMTVTRGKKHVFLGMDIEFHEDGTTTIKMKDYIKEAIADFGESIVRQAATPAKKNLFDIDEHSESLTSPERDTFHSIVAKLLYVSKRCRLDIQLAVAFLCTRVSCSTEKDWAKLKRVLEYLNGTLDEFLVLGADDMGIMKTWVDASYAVHNDMKSHTGGVVSFGRGATMSKSSKQKLNTKSSTEAELVGASDYLPYPIWAKKFLEAQGYELAENIFYQDNQSTMRFEKNGRKSCGPNSRHIDIRYFFIKDRIDIEGIDVQYCPTEQMLADFFTKPLQGSLFKKF
jgi:hypothetical protein